ncbi:hypothetical protein [Ramlibacter montanisoli]|uniref:Uncharacterized protein n=1 Tax=Ramlibacter montanisoli TaxID=2732512 RepID=A0A849K4G6_9BURK|nr:hypothetical protein [Ramlibacter montanisoli]NNU43318.1 hypothetical protein [Ramlibacter montanisoli]
MGLIDRIFGSGKEREGAGSSATTQYRESEPDSDQPGSRDSTRRELVQVVLRDTKRKHGIPSDWIECRLLSTVSSTGRHGLHVNFVVKQAHDRLLAYVFAFQESFERELARFEPRARDWLLSLGWEFQGFNAAEMPDPKMWAQSGPAPLVQADWRPHNSGFGELSAQEPPKGDEDVQHDLKALFAIRDAAIAQTGPRKGREPEGQKDFQPRSPSTTTTT